ncbi:GGDEF domain-containing protein [uncultured Desulfovibrio sp.]|uniref:GGDEF domain-containing protein n=1 Tax=uncultured Desulfovibrio sp. TaxID=167968 RepID=UPI002630EFC3|nr:GGDEF domain-containing protein [uncultured Desulfovibrio sp.]
MGSIRIGIRTFGLSTLIVMLVLLVFQAYMLSTLQRIESMANAAAHDHLPNILQRQQFLLNIEHMRLNAAQMRFAINTRQLQQSSTSLRMLLADAGFSNPGFSAVLDKVYPLLDELMASRLALFELVERVRRQELRFLLELGRLAEHIEWDETQFPLLAAPPPQQSAHLSLVTGTYAFIADSVDQLFSACLKHAPLHPETRKPCDALEKTWQQLGAKQQEIRRTQEHFDMLVQDIDQVLVSLSVEASSVEARGIYEGMETIDNETRRIRSIFTMLGIGTALFLLLFFAALQQQIFLPLRRTTEILRAMRGGQGLPRLPQTCIEELSSIIDILPSLNAYLNDLHQRSGQLEQERERFAGLSLTDDLTGLGNRRALDQAIQKDRQTNALAVLMVDVDNFKRYNDTLGHLAGDVALQTVARMVRQNCARATDKTFRYGGEEFVALLTATSREGGMAVAESLRDAVERLHIPHPGQDTGVLTISVGVASRDQGDITHVEELLARADSALYAAKKTGRNRACHFEEASPEDGQPA